VALIPSSAGPALSPSLIMTEIGVQNLASFMFIHAKFQLDRFIPLRLRASYIEQSNETEKIN